MEVAWPQKHLNFMNKLIIFLMVLLLLFGGGGALYYFSPTVKEYIDNLIIKKEVPVIPSPENGQATATTSATSSLVDQTLEEGPILSQELKLEIPVAEQAAQFEALLVRLPIIQSKLDAKKVLEDRNYNSLQDFSVVIVSEDKGNPVPFKKRSTTTQVGPKTNR